MSRQRRSVQMVNQWNKPETVQKDSLLIVKAIIIAILIVIISLMLLIVGEKKHASVASGGHQTIEDLGAGKTDTGATGATVKTIVLSKQ